MAVHPHPYIPADIKLPGYQPHVIPYETILTIFFGGSALVVAAMYYITGAPAQQHAIGRQLAAGSGWPPPHHLPGLSTARHADPVRHAAHHHAQGASST